MTIGWTTWSAATHLRHLSDYLTVETPWGFMVFLMFCFFFYFEFQVMMDWTDGAWSVNFWVKMSCHARYFLLMFSNELVVMVLCPFLDSI